MGNLQVCLIIYSHVFPFYFKPYTVLEFEEVYLFIQDFDIALLI